MLAACVLSAAGAVAEEVTLLKDVMMRGDRVLASIKAGTVVEIVSRNDHAVIIRHNGNVGAIPPDSVPEVKRQEAPSPDAPAFVLVTPAIILGPLTLFLANTPGDSPDELRQYIPDDEILEHWAHMASTRVIKGAAGPQAYLADARARATSANSRNRAGSWPVNGENVLELVEYVEMPNRIKFAQWSLTRANLDDAGKLVVYQYAVRYYGYGDSTNAEMEKERAAAMDPFVARLSFDEVTTIPKPHNVRLTLTTDATVESAFPGGSFVYEPKFSMEFTGDMPGGIDIPMGKSKEGHIACLAATQDVLLNPAGVGMLSAEPSHRALGESFLPMDSNHRGPFTIRADSYLHSAFRVPAGGVYAFKVTCYLKDSSGKPYLVVGSQNVTIVDKRRLDSSPEPPFQP